MIERSKKYLKYILSYLQSDNKKELINDLIDSIKTQGIKLGIKDFLHQKSIVNKGMQNVGVTQLDYQLWLLNSHIPNQVELIKQSIVKFDYMPLMSIVTPTFNTPKSFLIEMIESVIAQSYTHWELCIADGASTNQETIDVLNDYQNKYPNKIKVVFLDENYHISCNTNEALKLTSGDYVSFFDHDDLLTPNCLFEYVKKINEDNKPALLYCDEDKTNENSTKFLDPFFKPDFGVFNIRSNNYICHLMTIRSDVLQAVGSFDSNCNGAQDYDMVLRVVDYEFRVSHISKILYHWRVHANSTAGADNGAKPYTHFAGKLALEKHLVRNNILAEIKDDFVPNIYKVDYEIQGNPLVSIIIPRKDNIDDLRLCISSIYEKSTYNNFEIIIVENHGTEDQIFEYYRSLEKYDNLTKVIHFDTLGFNFSKVMNHGASYAKGDYLLLLNDNISIITPDWIQEMLMYAQLKNVGAVGAKLYYPDDTIQHGGVVIGVLSVAGHKSVKASKKNNGYFGYYKQVHNVSAVTAACMMVPKKVFNNVNGLTEDFAVAFNDVDLCMKIRELNYDIVMNPHCELYHYESKFRVYEDTFEKKEISRKEINLFAEKWGLWRDDPYYNINFTKLNANYKLRLNSER